MSQASQFAINFVAGPSGPIMPEGSTLTVGFPNAKAIFGGIWKKGENGPTIIFGAMNSMDSVILKRSNISLKGKVFTLKVRAYLQDWTNQYIETDFTIV